MNKAAGRNTGSPAALRRWLLPLFSALFLVVSSMWFLLSEPGWQMQPIAQAWAADTANANPPVRSPLDSELRAFIEHYFNVLEKGDVEQLMTFYANQVDYYTWGIVDKVLVAQEKADYFVRWPLVQQNLVGELEITSTAENSEILVTYLLSFSVYNPQQKDGPIRISGQARHSWRLRQTPEGWKITEEKQRVLSRLRNYKEKSSKSLVNTERQ